MAQVESLTFGAVLRRHRRDAGPTQEELAERAGLSVRGISDLERDVKQRPHRETVELLVDALQLGEVDRATFQTAARGGRSGGHSLEESAVPQDVLSDPASTLALPGGFLGARPDGPLVGRQDELAHILRSVREVTGGIGRLVLIAGEPGAGKTRLAQEVTLHVETEGFLVATGRCFEQHGTIPYYPFLEALATVFRAASVSLRATAGERWPFLAPLLPDDLSMVQSGPTDRQEDQLRVFRAVTRFLMVVAQERPLALLLDDIHWADAASLELLQHLARGTRGSPILLVGIYRDVEVRRRYPLGGTLRDLGHDGLLERVTVRRLDRTGTASLLATNLAKAEISDALVDLVHAQAEGNPFFTQEILRALTERGDVLLRNGAWNVRGAFDIEVPESIRSAIDERVSRLTDGAQSVLIEASVLGHAFTFDEIVAMSRSSEMEVELALDAATEAELLQERNKDSYAFGHALVQQALYADISSRRKRRLHRAAGTALESIPERRRRRQPAELAWHFLEGDDVERALHWTLLAGDQAEATFAHVEAEAQYRVGLELAEQVGEPESEAAAREKLAGVLLGSGRYDEGLPIMKEAMCLYRQIGDLESEARPVARIAEVLYQRGAREEARTLLETICRRLEAKGASSGLAQIYFQLGIVSGVGGDMEHALHFAERGIQAARAAEDETQQLFGEVFRGNILYLVGRLDESVEMLTDVVKQAEDHPLRQADLSLALQHLGAALFYRGDLAMGIRYVERTLELDERLAVPMEVAFTLHWLAGMLWFSGDWGAARHYAQRAAGIAQSVAPKGHVYGTALCWLGMVALCTGIAEEGVRYLEAVTSGEMGVEPGYVSWAAACLADWELLEGRPDVALRRLEPLPRDGLLYGLVHLDALARVYLALGDVAEAETIIVGWIERCRGQVQTSLADALWTRGAIYAHQEQWEEAGTSFAEAIALAREMPYPFAEARALYHWGLEDAKRQNHAQARERLESALALFRRLGATPYIERTEQTLAMCSRF